MKEERARKHTKDNGWAWFICMSCFFGNFILGGIKRSFGLALPIMKTYFKTNTTAISWVASILEGMYYVVGPLASFIADKLNLGLINVIGSILTAIGLCISTFVPNIFLMMVTYSVICGLGLGFIYLPASVACNYFFKRRLGLATGISKTGYSIGGIIFPLLAHSLISISGWKAMFYMFSGTALINCGLGTVINSIPQLRSVLSLKETKVDEDIDSNNTIIDDTFLENEGENSDNPEENMAFLETKSSSFQNKETSSYIRKNKVVRALKDMIDTNIMFLLFLTSRFFIHFGGSLPYIFLPTLMLNKNLSLSQGAYVLSAAACSNTVSRFTVCAITDHPCAPSAMVTTVVSSISSGLIMTTMPFCYNMGTFMAAAMLYGFLCAPVASLLSVVLMDIVSLENLNNSFGMVAFVQGIGTIAGPPTAGLIIDHFKLDYGISICYVIGGLCMVLAGILSFLAKILPVDYRINQKE